MGLVELLLSIADIGDLVFSKVLLLQVVVVEFGVKVLMVIHPCARHIRVLLMVIVF